MMQQKTSVSAARTPSSSFGDYIAGLAERLHGREFNPGDRAMLRRLSPDQDAVPPNAYWRLLGDAGISWENRAFWYAVLPLLVRHPHIGGEALGEALTAAVSEARLERWLRAPRERARVDARRVFARLDRINWTEAGPLLRFWSKPARWQVAAHFFQARQQQEQSTYRSQS